MNTVTLFYLSPNTTGGWVTFTANLIEAFEAVGVRVVLRKIGNKSELKGRPFGYGKTYFNTSEEDAYDLAIHQPCLIVAAAKKFKDITEQMIDFGAKIVVHDPTELKNLPELDPKDCVVIRQTGLRMLPTATFIRHPYTRKMAGVNAIKSKLCVSTSRIDFDKHTTILLDANRILPDDRQIEIRGFENRLYTKFKVIPEYPEWVQSIAAYPREWDAAIDILRHARFMADMSIIKGDGGGTQYTFLEAWDAGAVPIIHEDWVIPNDDMVPDFNCCSVSNGEELAEFLNRYADTTALDDYRQSLRVQGYKQLELHRPEVIGLEYRKFMGV